VQCLKLQNKHLYLEDIILSYSKNKKYKDIVILLRQRVNTCIAGGELKLPSEPALAVEFATSRMTLRKAIQVLVDENILEKTYNGTFIKSVMPKPGISGNVLFIGTGEDNIFYNQAIERLWNNVNLLTLKETSIISKSLIMNGYPDVDILKSELDKTDLVLIGMLPGNHLEEVVEIINNSRKTVILLNQDYQHCFSRLICLDDYKIGQQAAEAIIKSGYKRPFFLGFNFMKNRVYFPFEERFRGFKDRLVKENFPVDNIKLMTNVQYIDETIQLAQDQIVRMLSAGYDSVFLYSDEASDMIFGKFFRQGIIPEKLGVITIDASGVASRNIPPITYVAYMIEEIARTAVEKTKLFFSAKVPVATSFRSENKAIQYPESGLENEFQIYIAPEIFYKSTLKTL
jgi:DNA-binding transcriptional regulator YhcF (GntR family)